MTILALAAALSLAAAPSLAGGPKPAASPKPGPVAAPRPAPAAAPPPAPQPQGYPSAPPKPALPRMEMQAQYQGPLQDTVIQRWRDPVDGTICYIYLPVIVAHSPTTQTGFVQYGANGIGTISCFAGPAPAAR